MNIEKDLLPENGILQIQEDLAVAKILDAELDVLECVFTGDGSVVIDTENLEYISLTLDNLKELRRLIIESDKHYDNEK